MGGVLGAVARFLTPIGNILSVIGGAITIFQALRPPKIPKFQMPTQLFNTLNQRIQSLTGISEEARANIRRSLEMYNRGELLPQYKSRLDEEYERKKKEAENVLAARGLLNSSLALDVAAELNRWYLRTYFNLLFQQVNDALAMSGLATADINAIMSEIRAFNQAIQSQIQSLTLGELLNLGRGRALETGLEMIIRGAERLAPRPSIPQAGTSTSSTTSTTTPTTTTSSTTLTSSIPETQSIQPTQISPSLEEYEKALKGE